MQACAIGIRVHSGWGALVAVAGETNNIDVLERKRIEIIDPCARGAAQPYHFARELDLPIAEKFIANSKAAATERASAALREVVDRLKGRGYRTAGAAILLSSERPLPDLEKILASHPMVHTAEGKLFRYCFAEACSSLNVPVTGIGERDVAERAQARLGKASTTRIASLGKVLGAPWTNDQKSAALAATIVLAELVRT